MPATIERPKFNEGQILGSQDLESLQQYARDQGARHARYAHAWGIVDGLEVKLGSDGDLEIGPGLAIDSSGAALILATTTYVSTDKFANQLSAGENAGQYPLFLTGLQKTQTLRAIGGTCSGTSGARIQEAVDLQFRRQSALVGWDDQKAPSVGDGPDDNATVPRLVLLGFVTWDKAATKKFTKFDMGVVTIDGRNYGRRYLGVRGDSVEAIGGSLTLRTKPPSTVDAPLVVLDPTAADGNTFTFGVDNGSGGVKSLLQVNKNGDVTAAGKISGAVDLKPGEVYVQSGQITDGLCVPLPDGVTDPMVQAGSVTVHLMLTPRFHDSAKPDGAPFPILNDCSVDLDRRVSCLSDWYAPASMATAPVTLAGLCDYLLVATVSSTPEPTS
jgi:hypothetical protein